MLILRAPAATSRLAPLVARTVRPFSSAYDDKQYDVSYAEQDRINRRAAIRKDLKAHFNRSVYNPYRQIYHVELHDPAVERFMAARASRYDYWKPSWHGFIIWFLTQIFPIFAFGYYLSIERAEHERKCRSGELPYRDRKTKWTYVGDGLNPV